MDKKQWIITLVLIIVVAVVAFNFNNWTGKATVKKSTMSLKIIENAILPLESKVTVLPADITAGEKIIIKIEPARDTKICLDSAIELYKVKDDGSLGLRTKENIDTSSALGSKKNCDEVVEATYKTISGREGRYVAVAKEYIPGKGKDDYNQIISPVFVLT